MCMKVSGKQARLQMMQEAQAAAEARQREDERQGRLKAGTSTIDSLFSGFGDDFYGKYKDNYLSFYNPEVDKQFGKAKDELTYGHARSGTLNSSAAGTNLADLTYQNDINKAQIASKADAAAAGLRQNVGSQKQAVLSQLYSTENPDIAANTALNSVRTIQNAQPDLNPLGDIFKLAAVGGGAAYNAYNDPYARLGSPPGFQGTGRNVQTG